MLGFVDRGRMRTTALAAWDEVTEAIAKEIARFTRAGRLMGGSGRHTEHQKIVWERFFEILEHIFPWF